MIFTIFVMLTGIASFSYILNKIQDIIKNNNTRKGIVDVSKDLEEWLIKLGGVTKIPL